MSRRTGRIAALFLVSMAGVAPCFGATSGIDALVAKIDFREPSSVPAEPTQPAPAARDAPALAAERDAAEIAAERERLAVWHGPEMQRALAWLDARLASLEGHERVAAAYYLARLAELDAEGLRRWLSGFHDLRQRQLEREIADAANERFERVRVGAYAQQRSRYFRQAAYADALRSQSAERGFGAEPPAPPRRPPGRGRPGPGGAGAMRCR